MLRDQSLLVWFIALNFIKAIGTIEEHRDTNLIRQLLLMF